MSEIKLSEAIRLILDGQATYEGTTHTDQHGYAAIITRHDTATTDHVIDVGPIDIMTLREASN